MRMAEYQGLVRACLEDPDLDHRQRRHRLAVLAEDALEPPAVSEACRAAQADGLVHDMGEGHAPWRPRYVLPDYARLLERGSDHLELPPAADLEDALTALLATYPSVPSVTGYPVYLGDLDRLLEPYAADADDDRLHAALTRFWRLVDRTMPDAFVHADLGPDDLRTTRALLRVDRELRQVVPNLTLRVDPRRTPDALLREAVLTACADGKPHFVNHPMMVADHGARYGVVSCYNSLPLGGGAHTLVRLNLARAAAAAPAGSGVDAYLDEVLPGQVELAAELVEARVRHLVERTPFYTDDWLVTEGLVDPARFTAMFGVYGVAEAVGTLLDAAGTPGRYGADEAADRLAVRLVARVAELVAAREVPHCAVSGGRALLHAQSGIASDTGVTPGVRIPPGHEPGLYDHIRTVAPHHRHFAAGVSDVMRFEPTVADNPQAVVAVMRGAFAEGMRDWTFDVEGNGFVRITGYLVRTRDVEAVTGARYSTTALGAEAIPHQQLADRVVRGTPGAPEAVPERDSTAVDVTAEAVPERDTTAVDVAAAR